MKYNCFHEEHQHQHPHCNKDNKTKHINHAFSTYMYTYILLAQPHIVNV